MKDTVVGLLATVVVWVIVLIPTWIFLGVRYFANPDGFWQNLAVFGAGLYFFGGMQFLLFILGVALTLKMWDMVD